PVVVQPVGVGVARGVPFAIGLQLAQRHGGAVAAAQVEEHQGGEPVGEHRLGRGSPGAAIVGGGDDARGRGDVEGVWSGAAAQVLHSEVELVAAVPVAVDGDHSGGFGVVPLRIGPDGGDVPSCGQAGAGQTGLGSPVDPVDDDLGEVRGVGGEPQPVPAGGVQRTIVSPSARPQVAVAGCGHGGGGVHCGDGESVRGGRASPVAGGGRVPV